VRNPALAGFSVVTATVWDPASAGFSSKSDRQPLWWQCPCTLQGEVDMLHKTSYLRGFHLIATDGEIGHVDDLLFDESWSIRWLVVDISNWIGGKSVLVPVEAVEQIDSPGKKILVRMTRDDIKKSRPADTADVELIETLPPTII
jgi:PRC-barrel domain